MLHESQAMVRQEHFYYIQQAISTTQVSSLLADMRKSLDADLNLARRYLDQLSALFEEETEIGVPEALLLPRRLDEHGISTKGGLAGWQVRRVTAHIEQNLDTSLVTEELARVAQLSTGHFCRAFKASMGETPHAYIVRQRLRRAQTMMLKTRDTLSQIACACGLTDQAHLTRLFRRAIGTTPMLWRRDRQHAA